MKTIKFVLAAAITLMSVATHAANITTKAAVPDRQRVSCLAADLNHDGFVTLSEFHQDILQGWRSLYPSSSGYVSLEDLASVPGLGRNLMDRLKTADADGDGRLSFKEVVVARMSFFDAADINNDDQLSIQECIDHQRRSRAAGGGSSR